MLNADVAPYFQTCPRCHEGGLEVLQTHAHCVNCNYEEIFGSDEICAIPEWVHEILARRKICSRNNKRSTEHLSPTLGLAL